MTKTVKKIAVTGGAGQLAYAFLFRVASGELFGKDQPISLHILEIPEAEKALEGVRMELEDCAFPCLKEVVIGSDPYKVFADVDYAVLIGAKPRSKGMERGDLLRENANIFIKQGKALNEVASKNVQVLVVGNPCNTNCWITMKMAPNIPAKNFHAMTRLDQNRGSSQLAHKAGVGLDSLERFVIWGNHSATQVPDFCNMLIDKKPVSDFILDRNWLENDFCETLQKRGSAIINARGKSSAASAANAALEAMKDIVFPTNVCYSDAIISDGNPYGISEDLIFSFPCINKGYGDWEIVSGFTMDDFLKEKISLTEKELLAERDEVSKIIKGNV